MHITPERHRFGPGGIPFGIRPAHRLAQPLRVKQVALDQGEVRMCERLFEEAWLSGREVVDANDGPTGGQEAIDKAAADEAGSAGDVSLG